MSTELSPRLDTTVVEKPSSRVKHGIARAADIWFRPKRVERETKIYQHLGIKTFIKYWPNTGGYASRKLFPKFHSRENTLVSTDIGSLKTLDKKSMRMAETAHELSFAVIGGCTIYGFTQDFPIYVSSLFVGANLLANVYPIMLQRYNRARLYNTISRIERRNAPNSRQG